MYQLDEQKVELFISCRDLINPDGFEVSHQHVILLGFIDTTWFELGRTEQIDNNLNPNFVSSISLDYHFEIQQYLIFEVHHYVGNQHYKYIGKTTLSEIVGSKDKKISFQICDQTNLKVGNMIIRADYVNHCSDLVAIIIQGRDILKGQNLFLRFYRLINDDPNPLLVYQTEPIKNNKSLQWQTINCKAQKLCNGDYQMPIKIELWDYIQNGTQVLLGHTQICLDQLKNRPAEKHLINFQNQIIGTLQMQFNWIIPLVNFILEGLQLNLLVAIDFTGSNKDVDDITSLHYQDPIGAPSLYEQAITSVGDILINYDYDKKVPVYGFGCKPKLNGTRSPIVNHCFPLNGNKNDPEVFGLQGIIQLYRDTVKMLEFHGPTYFHHVIQEAMNQAKKIQNKKQNNYLILLILTDGQTDDLKLTIDDIIASAHLPLSIIIIGIGDADFNKMKILDNDDLSMIDSQGQKSQRDMVQFVPFNKYKCDAALLSKEVLKELPDQVVQYMKLTNQPLKSANNIFQQQIKGTSYQQPQAQDVQINYPQF